MAAAYTISKEEAEIREKKKPVKSKHACNRPKAPALLGDCKTPEEVSDTTREMNPIEQIWKEIRKREFKNEIFPPHALLSISLPGKVVSPITLQTIAGISGAD